jgi:tRNA pseudouridine55 synthase
MNNNKQSGFIAIDKPAWISSFDVIRSLRKITGIRKIGHSGTLDPFATGLLVCCIGAYTRLAKYVEAEDKCYSATIKLGEKSETGDPEGAIIETAELPKKPYAINAIVQKAMELTELPIPAYSAIKLDGKRAYALARSGHELEMPVRAMKINEFSFIPHADGSIIDRTGTLSYRCTVSKGTYIRSLSEWLAEQLGTLGYTLTLRRQSIGIISITQAVQLDELNNDNWQNYLLEPKFVLAHLSEYHTKDEDLPRISNGGDLLLPPELLGLQTDIAMYDTAENLIAIGKAENDKLQPRIVLL